MFPRLFPKIAVPQAVSFAHCASRTMGSIPVPAEAATAVELTKTWKSAGVMRYAPLAGRDARTLAKTYRWPASGKTVASMASGAAGFARDRALDRVVGCLCDAGGVEAILPEDVGGFALRQELVRQREVSHPAGQPVRGERLQHRASKASSAHVVLDRQHERVAPGPIDDPRIDGLDPTRVDDRALDASQGQAFGRFGRDLDHSPDREDGRDRKSTRLNSSHT